MTISAPPPTLLCRFGPLDVEYDERVLEPRQWTLLQSSWAADIAATAPPGRMLELFAGAGHIGLTAALLAERDLVQVELDPVAAHYARRNAIRAGRARGVEVRVGSISDVLDAAEAFPVIVADPPYLPSVQIAEWPDDPPLAIDGGADGLTHIRACLASAQRHLAPGGALLLQVAGPSQTDQVRALLDSADCPLRVVAERVADSARAVALLERTS
jgi:release factor glutamine methyltransferase